MKIVRFFLLFFTTIYALHLYLDGFNETAVLSGIRVTARFSLFLFLATFVASPLSYFLKGKITKLLLKNRSELGISFAISHLFHLAFILSFAALDMPKLMDGRNILILSFGVVTYIFIISMMLTSFPKYRKTLSQSSWKKLHTIGSWFIFVVFANSYIGRVLRSEMDYLPYGALIFVAFLLRVFYLTVKKKKELKTK
jgi:hypothetical protein